MDFLNNDGVLSLTGSDGIVRTSGNQTIRGVKTFKDTLIEEGTIECSRLDANFIFSKSPADYLIVQSNTSTAWTAGSTFAATADQFMNLTSNTDNVNLTAGKALQHNSQTFNPRRQYNLNYTNGLTTEYYGLEIIKSQNDPNNTLSPAPTNGKTYIEIISNGNLAAAYNSSRINGYFIGAGNSDSVNQCDFLVSTYDHLEPTFGPLYTGSSSNGYTSFVIYLIGGFNYRIITDGTIGQSWNNNATTKRWTPANSITYDTGSSTFAITKSLTFVDTLGATAGASAIVNGMSVFTDFNVYDYTSTRANKFKMTDSKIVGREQYIAPINTATTLQPVISFTKIGYRNGGTSSSMINWGLDATNVSLLAQLPYKSRCVAVDIVFDNDATPPTVSTRFQAYLGDTNAVASATYLDTSNFIIISSTSWSTTTGWADGTQVPDQDLVIPAGTPFYGSWRLVNASTLAAVTLNQEFIITFYFQQLP